MAGPNSLPPFLGWVDQVADRFEAAWRSGSPPDLADFLEGASDEPRRQLLVELVKIDLEHRWRLGDHRSLEAYRSQFPELGPDKNLDLFLEELRRGQEISSTGPDLPRPVTEPPLPSAIGKYPVVSRLGGGGQADVYRAVHPTLGQDLAIKVSHFPFSLDPAERNPLLAEGRILADLSHPHLVKVYDFGFFEGRPFLVLEHVRGCPLQRYAEAQSLTPRQAAVLLAKVARALVYLHGHGIVHQDLKPQNIMMDEAGEPKILDFGLAQLRQTWAIEAEQPSGGSPPYMAPEQARWEQERVGPRTDLFALGAILYWLLVGQPPFKGLDRKETLERARRCEFDRQALRRRRVPRPLAALCLRAMAEQPEERFPSANDMAAALERFTRRPSRRTVVIFGMTLVLVLTGLLGWKFFPKKGLDPVPSSLQVEVWQDGRWVSLSKVGYLNTEDELQVQVQVPAEYPASLFWVSNTGQLSFQGPLEPGQPTRIRLKEPAGTELLLVCGRRGEKVRAEEVQRLWDVPVEWPKLPRYVILQLHRDQVRALPTRSMELLPAGAPGAQKVVHDQMETLRRRLSEEMDFFEGVAFSHDVQDSFNEN